MAVISEVDCGRNVSGNLDNCKRNLCRTAANGKALPIFQAGRLGVKSKARELPFTGTQKP
jgi:hypothetical protein